MEYCRAVRASFQLDEKLNLMLLRRLNADALRESLKAAEQDLKACRERQLLHEATHKREAHQYQLAASVD